MCTHRLRLHLCGAGANLVVVQQVVELAVGGLLPNAWAQGKSSESRVDCWRPAQQLRHSIFAHTVSHPSKQLALSSVEGLVGLLATLHVFKHHMGTWYIQVPARVTSNHRRYTRVRSAPHLPQTHPDVDVVVGAVVQPVVVEIPQLLRSKGQVRELLGCGLRGHCCDVCANEVGKITARSTGDILNKKEKSPRPTLQDQRRMLEVQSVRSVIKGYVTKTIRAICAQPSLGGSWRATKQDGPITRQRPVPLQRDALQHGHLQGLLVTWLLMRAAYSY